jgi:hypothetical protein
VLLFFQPFKRRRLKNSRFFYLLTDGLRCESVLSRKKKKSTPKPTIFPSSLEEEDNEYAQGVVFFFFWLRESSTFVRKKKNNTCLRNSAVFLLLIDFISKTLYRGHCQRSCEDSDFLHTNGKGT